MSDETKQTALVPYDDLKRMAQLVVAGGLFKEVVKTQEEALTLMLVAQAEGIHPMAALSRYSIIQGRPAKKAAAMLADFKGKGGSFRWLSDGSEGEACIELHTPGAIEPILGKFSMTEAKAAGLVREGSGWTKYPKAMLQARAVSAGMRMADPACASLYTPEEIADFEPRVERAPIRMPTRIIDVEAEAPIAKESDIADAKPDSGGGEELPLSITKAEAAGLWRAAKGAGVTEGTFRALIEGMGYKSTLELPKSMLQGTAKLVQEGEDTVRMYVRTLFSPADE